MHDTTVIDNAGDGIVLPTYGNLDGIEPTFTGNFHSQNGGAPVCGPAEQMRHLDASSSLAGNGEPILITASTVATSATWHAVDEVYRQVGVVRVEDPAPDRSHRRTISPAATTKRTRSASSRYSTCSRRRTTHAVVNSPHRSSPPTKTMQTMRSEPSRCRRSATSNGAPRLLRRKMACASESSRSRRQTRIAAPSRSAASPVKTATRPGCKRGLRIPRGRGGALRPHRFAIIGHDSGGAMARIAAASAPTRVTALALSNTEVPGHVPTLVKRLQAASRLPGAAWVFGMLLRSRGYVRSKYGFGGCFEVSTCSTARSPAATIDPLREGGIDGAMAAIRRADLGVSDRLTEIHRKIEAPTLCVWSDGDPFFPVRHARAMVDNWPGSARVGVRIEVIPGKELLVHEESPHEVAALFRPFLLERSLGA